MKTQTKIIVAVIAAELLYLYLRKGPSASVGINVTKTSGECSPNAVNYSGAAYCNASNNPVDAVTNAASTAGGALGNALGSLGSIFGIGGNSPDTATSNDDSSMAAPGASPTIGNNPDVSQSRSSRAKNSGNPTVPQMNAASLVLRSSSVPGGDGPLTRPLQMITGLGTRLGDQYSDHQLPARVGDR